MSDGNKRVLVIVFDGVEEIEALAPVDLLRRAGIETTIASFNGETLVHGRNGITFSADLPLSATDTNSFDAIFLPGGPGVFELIDDEKIHAILRQNAQSNRLTAAICAAPKVLAAAGLLDSLRATSHASVRDDLPNPSDQAVVEDSNIITSQGAGTAIEFALALVAKLVSAVKADEVAASIHASNPSSNK